MAVRILIADDHGVMRAGLRALLEDEQGLEVIGEAADGEEALRLSGELVPDIVLMDIGLQGVDGIEITRRLRKNNPAIKVLILSVYEEESLLRESFKVGAAGYVPKRAAEEDLITAIKAVSRGDMYVHPGLIRLVIRDLAPVSGGQEDAIELLTPRELAILGYIIRGYTNRQIAEELFISRRTVEGHRASLMSKLGLKNRVELIEYAKKYGLSDR